MMEIAWLALGIAFGLVVGRGWQRWHDRQLRWYWRWNLDQPDDAVIEFHQSELQPPGSGWTYVRRQKP